MTQGGLNAAVLGGREGELRPGGGLTLAEPGRSDDVLAPNA